MAVQGPNFPNNGVNDNSIGTVAWTNPGNITLDDGSYAQASILFSNAYTNYLVASNFGFAIPDGSQIDGILVEIDRMKTPSSDSVTDNSIVIRKSNGTYGTVNKAIAGEWPTVFTYQNYGGAEDLWGESWTAADINNSNFGVALSSNFMPDIQSIGRVDVIRMTIYYSEMSINSWDIALV